jgi:single-strand DNA-binding protein
MAGSYTKTVVIGNVGNDPEFKTMQSGDRVCNLSVATSESWKDKATGERKERTEWHRIVCFNQPLVTLIENYVRKGSKVHIEGQNVTRSYEQDGVKKYTTEVVMRPFKSEITLLDSKGQSEQTEAHKPSIDELEDDIPL